MNNFMFLKKLTTVSALHLALMYLYWYRSAARLVEAREAWKNWIDSGSKV